MLAQERADRVVRQRLDRVAIAPGHGLVGDQRVDHGFVDRPHCRLEQRGQRGVGDEVCSSHRVLARQRSGIGSREGQEDVARAVRRDAARARDAEAAAPGQAPELMGQERRIGRQDADHRARVANARRSLFQAPADRDAGDGELLGRAEVGLHEGAQGKAPATASTRREAVPEPPLKP